MGLPRVQPSSRSQVTASEHSRTEAKPPRNARWGCRDQVPSTTTWAGSPATGASPQHRVSQALGPRFLTGKPCACVRPGLMWLCQPKEKTRAVPGEPHLVLSVRLPGGLVSL